MRIPTPAADAACFWAKVDRSGGPDACWLWIGRIGLQGYGTVCRNYKSGLAHRKAWVLTNGPIPAGLFVCHHCDVRPCVNPGHLFLGTPADNMRDAALKGRSASGERGGTSKLTLAQVNDIRAALKAGERHRSIAVRFGVHCGTIASISSGRSWRHSRLSEAPRE